MSAADYRRNIFLLIILINVKQFCNANPRGAIAIPNGRDEHNNNPINYNVNSADYRRDIFLLKILISLRQLCDRHLIGAIVIPNDLEGHDKNPINYEVKPAVPFTRRLGTPVQGNNFEHSPEYYRSQQSAGFHIANLRDIDQEVKLSIPKSNVTAKSSMLISNTVASVSKSGNINVSTPENSATDQTSIPKGNNTGASSGSLNTTTTLDNEDDEDDDDYVEYRPRFKMQMKRNCKSLTGPRCARTKGKIDATNAVSRNHDR